MTTIVHQRSKSTQCDLYQLDTVQRQQSPGLIKLKGIIATVKRQRVELDKDIDEFRVMAASFSTTKRFREDKWIDRMSLTENASTKEE